MASQDRGTRQSRQRNRRKGIGEDIMANRLHTPLCDTLGMEYPILLAGMAVGGSQDLAPTPVEMVAAISNAGALGVLGDNFRNLDEMDEGLRRLKSLVGDKPYGMDFLVPATRAEVTASSNQGVVCAGCAAVSAACRARAGTPGRIRFRGRGGLRIRADVHGTVAQEVRDRPGQQGAAVRRGDGRAAGVVRAAGPFARA